jgi:hypothetical protein
MPRIIHSIFSTACWEYKGIIFWKHFHHSLQFDEGKISTKQYKMFNSWVSILGAIFQNCLLMRINYSEISYFNGNQSRTRPYGLKLRGYRNVRHVSLHGIRAIFQQKRILTKLYFRESSGRLTNIIQRNNSYSSLKIYHSSPLKKKLFYDNGIFGKLKTRKRSRVEVRIYSAFNEITDLNDALNLTWIVLDPATEPPRYLVSQRVVHRQHPHQVFSRKRWKRCKPHEEI